MAKRRKSRPRRDRRQMVWYIITLAVALSMALSYVLVALAR